MSRFNPEGPQEEAVVRVAKTGPRARDLRDMVTAALDRWYTSNVPVHLEMPWARHSSFQFSPHIRPMIDFIGIAYRIPVAFCCLTVDTDYLSYSELQPLSAEALFRFQQMGGHAFVAAYFRSVGWVVRIGIEELVAHRNHFGGESLSIGAMASIGSRITTNLVNDVDLLREERITLKEHAIPRRLIALGKSVWP